MLFNKIKEVDNIQNSKEVASYNEAASTAISSSQINVTSMTNNITGSAFVIKNSDNKLGFNLMESLPANSQIKAYNVNLFGRDNKGLSRLLKSNFNLNTVDFDTTGLSDLELKGSVVYEDLETSIQYESKFDKALGVTDVTSNLTFTPYSSLSSFNTDAELIQHLVGKITSLENRITALELLNSANG